MHNAKDIKYPFVLQWFQLQIHISEEKKKHLDDMWHFNITGINDKWHKRYRDNESRLYLSSMEHKATPYHNYV